MAQKLTQEQFIDRCILVHGDKYDYSKVEYINTRTKVEIVCKKHGLFLTNPDHFISGKGCIKCGYESAINKTRSTQEKVILEFKRVHGDKYDYSKVEYVNSQTKVEIICTKHGSFWMKPNKHIHSKRGCIKCGLVKSKITSENTRSDTVEFIEKSKIAHDGDKYDYSKVEYVNSQTKVEIICKKHGSFFQKPSDHLDSHGCKMCPKNTNISSWHKELSDFLNSINISHLNNDRTCIYPQEIDILIESHNLAIELNGVYWHSKLDKNYHLDKYNKCKDLKIFLFQFWDVDWKNKKDIIKSMVSFKCGIVANKIHGRKCVLKEVNHKVYADFLNRNHIQGKCFSKTKIGVFHNDILVAIAGFTGNRLDRYCQLINTSVRGGLSKIIKYYSINYNVSTIETFSDNTYSDGKVYEKIGFVPIKNIRPDYKYFDGKDVIRKELFRRERLQRYHWFNPKLSESENMAKNGYHKIFDAGKIKWELKW